MYWTRRPFSLSVRAEPVAFALSVIVDKFI